MRDLYRLWFSVSGMSGITWWNLCDGAADGAEGLALGGLLDADLRPKPAYDALDRLINYEWRTNLKLTAEVDGVTHFRAFHGRYAISIEKDEKTKSMDLHVGANGPFREKLTIQ